MKKYIAYICLIFICAVFFSSCIWGNTWYGPLYEETRVELIKTNVIGFVGETANEPYIEIRYSIADEYNPGHNKTASMMVTPPYIFKNDAVYMTYKYAEEGFKNKNPDKYSYVLVRDFEEGGAEYLRIINHSPDKTIEFFFAGAHEGEVRGSRNLPDVRYKNAPIYYLLYPERKPAKDHNIPGDRIIYFEGDRIGDLVVTQAWTAEEVCALYRAEYVRSEEIKLTAIYGNRIIGYVEGNDPNERKGFLGSIFYGKLSPQEELRGSEKTWLLATRLGMFIKTFKSGLL